MFSAVAALRARVAELAVELEPGLFHPRDAARLVDELAAIEKMVTSMKAMLAARVAETSVWREGGERSAAEWLAKTTGSTVGQAQSALDTAKRAEQLPATREAMLAGALSPQQAAEVTAAAVADPGAEHELLAVASTEPMKNLRGKCAQTKAAAAPDEAARYRAVRDRRYWRYWALGDGGVRFEGYATPDVAARLAARIEPERDRLAQEYRRQGRSERLDACALDAVVNLIDRDGDDAAAARTVVHVRVDKTALDRGYTEPGELCELPGVGAVPVALAEQLMSDALIRVLLVDGHDIARIATTTAYIPATVKAAVDERDQICAVPGCSRRDHLEYHHLHPRARNGPTTAGNLAKVCEWHHHLITYDGYTLTGPPSLWTWHPPPLALTA
jgi:hypothetical protein